MRWQNHVQGFITKVQAPMRPVNIQVLYGCRAGLTKKIRNAKTMDELDRLTIIRDEIDFLINNL
jgi:hypothetical protein